MSLDDVSIETSDSRLIIEVDATRHEEFELHNHETTEFITHDGQIESTVYLNNNLINLDSYFDPDYFYDYSATMQKGDVEYVADWSTVEIRGDLFPNEVRKAAKKRAAEDYSYRVRTLAFWLWNADKDHIDRSVRSQLYQALRKEVESSDECPEWALCYHGDPDNWRHEMEPVTTLDEAKIYVRDGFKGVQEAREEDNV